MYERVAVRLGGGGHEEAGLVGEGAVEELEGADGVDPEDLDGKLGEVGGAGRRGEMHDHVETSGERVDGRPAGPG